MMQLEKLEKGKLFIKYVFLISSLFFLIFSSVPELLARENTQYVLGTWPLLAKYTDTDCLDIDDDRLDFIPSAISRKDTIHSKFALASYGGKIFINPEIHKGWNSISFSIESATTRVEESGLSCFQVMEIEIKAWPKKHRTLYIVQDKVVRYEIPIRISDEG